jgi:hypothetical protein
MRLLVIADTDPRDFTRALRICYVEDNHGVRTA